jgi:hypothetical protein
VARLSCEGRLPPQAGVSVGKAMPATIAENI